jgi:uncharacterized C2H2 Zn-finger protein
VSFSTTNTLFSFKELKVLQGLFKCALCPYIILNKKNLQRHLNNKHRAKHRAKPSSSKAQGLSPSNSYSVIANGQGLERNKYFFKVEPKSKGRETIKAKRGRGG